MSAKVCPRNTHSWAVLMGSPLLCCFTSVGVFLQQASWGGKREVGALSGRAVSGAAVSEGCGQGNVS